MDLSAPDVRPRLPEGPMPGVGIIGCGRIVRDGHLPAYAKYGVPVVGVYNRTPEAVAAVAEQYDVGRRFASLDELLAAPEVEIVDVATHPEVRAEIVRRALEAGKHVLSQKPFATDLATARELVELAAARGLRLAVNQNGRWTPAWRAATLLIERGAIGEPLAVTHMIEEHNRWLIGSHFDAVGHFVLYDFLVHVFDITRCWLDGKQPQAVRAREYRTPGQPREAHEAWGGLADVSYADGTSALVRAVGCSDVPPRLPFWIHGSEGTISGQVATGECVRHEQPDGTVTHFPLVGAWTPDGFAGTIGELMCAIEEGREPYNSGAHNLLSLELTLAAVASAEDDGAPVAIGAPAP